MTTNPSAVTTALPVIEPPACTTGYHVAGIVAGPPAPAAAAIIFRRPCCGRSSDHFVCAGCLDYVEHTTSETECFFCGHWTTPVSEWIARRLPIGGRS